MVCGILLRFVLHSLTPSEPQDSTSWSTTGMSEPISLSVKASTSCHYFPSASGTARRHAFLTATCCTLLLRLSPHEKVRVVTTPSTSESAPASVTPDSPPPMHAAMG
ncbi:unnamed protein product [Prorocentrum cordatum]|uniref:Secreted protein n=1 Tax=Prorocentrum cordatum TaxID=2364126 RepID=A0ABN9XG19_9DINO|nr:unnamed protein product [Polarella glacialis]